MQPELIGGRYRVERAIGQGGMGTVWLCRDERLHRSVAVKQVGLLPGESVTDSARALREARSTAALSHRNVVTVFDVVEEAGHIWLVMEYVPGRSLSQIIKQDGPLDPATVADLGAQVAAGLAAAHAAGTMHRDVKPGNVLVREDGVAKISDFGIARTAGDPALTQSGFLTGTPSYFSPELARGGDPGPGSDVWALGATLYAAVEGRPPYEQHPNPMAVLHDISSAPPPQPRRAGFLESALGRMLDRDPGSRWSMEDAAHVLGRLAETHDAEGTLKNTVESAVPASPAAPAAGEATTAAAAPTPAPTSAPPSAPPSAQEPDRRPAPAPTPAPAPAAAPRRPRRATRGRAVLAVLALALAVGAAILAVAQLGDDPSGDSSASQAEGSQTGKDSSSSGKGSDSGSDPGSDSASDSGSDSGSGTGSDSGSGASAKEQFVRDYYDAAPGGTDEAWAMLGPDLKSQGRGSYDGFWRKIESVEVKSVEAREGSDTVDVTLVYRTTDGRTSTERKQEGLVPSDDGGYLLNTDTPAG